MPKNTLRTLTAIMRSKTSPVFEMPTPASPAIASVEDVDLGAQRAVGAAVFSADHTGPDDRQNLGNAVQFQDRIGIVNFAVTERKKSG
jgi:hypothetical protein